MHSESIKNLAAALVKVQRDMPPAPFNASNPFLKNKYADLGSIIETARPHLAANGIAYSQQVVGSEGQIGVVTTLMHESGEWIENAVQLPAGEGKGQSLAQVAGSIITYLRRYSLAAALGIYADEDTDGNGGTPAPAPKQTAAKPAATLAPLKQTSPMVETAQELGGIPAELAAAMEKTTSKGTAYKDLSVSQLEFVIEKGGEESKKAAGLVRDWKIDRGEK